MNKYPTPDRSKFQPNEYRDVDVPEGDLGYREGELPDGRPFRVESWFTQGMTLLTFFFSVIDLEDATPEAVLALLSTELEGERVPQELRRLNARDIHTITDAAGHVMFSLTFVVGRPDL